MKLIRYINYIVQWISIIGLVAGFLMATVFEGFLEDYHPDDIGVIVGFVVLIYSWFYQLIFSLVSVLFYRKKSLFFKHLIFSFLYALFYATVLFLITEEIINDTFLGDVDSTIAYLLLLLSPSLVSLIYFYKLTFTILSPFKIYKDEDIQ
ncbi:MAG: hypothetical protein COA58_02230 [Bacteroidetes bacterium]|nr:MAG: hypothetical protein COA58_02230 [Bacteroidota bacterium]